MHGITAGPKSNLHLLIKGDRENMLNAIGFTGVQYYSSF